MYLWIVQASFSFADRNYSDSENHAWLFRLSQLAKSNKSWKDATLVGLVEEKLEGTRHYPRCQSGAIGRGWLKVSRSSARHVTNVKRVNMCVSTNLPHDYGATHPQKNHA